MKKYKIFISGAQKELKKVLVPVEKGRSDDINCGLNMRLLHDLHNCYTIKEMVKRDVTDIYQTFIGHEIRLAIIW